MDAWLPPEAVQQIPALAFTPEEELFAQEPGLHAHIAVGGTQPDADYPL
jgi:hypothetical protein